MLRPIHALLLVTTAIAIVLAASASSCAGSKNIDVGDDASTTQSVAPSMALFTSNLEPFFETNTCGRAACHDTTTHAGGTPYVLTLTSAGTTANYNATACKPRFNNYGTNPDGTLLTHFCVGGNPTAHSGITPLAGDCTNFKTFGQSGSGTPANCP